MISHYFETFLNFEMLKNDKRCILKQVYFLKRAETLPTLHSDAFSNFETRANAVNAAIPSVVNCWDAQKRFKAAFESACIF